MLYTRLPSSLRSVPPGTHASLTSVLDNLQMVNLPAGYHLYDAIDGTVRVFP